MHEVAPLLSFLGAFAMIFGIVYLRTRENMAMIEKGMNPRQVTRRAAPSGTLKYGLLFVGSGLGLLVAFLVDNNIAHRDDFHDNSPAIYFACIAIGGGLGLITSYAIERKEILSKREPMS